MDSDISDRVSVAKDMGMHPQRGPFDVVEGEHYTVLAYTDWCDMFVPTIVEWAHGEADDFSDREASEENKRLAVEKVRAAGVA